MAFNWNKMNVRPHFEPEDVFCPETGHLCSLFSSAALSPAQRNRNFIGPYHRSVCWGSKIYAPGLHLLQKVKGSPEMGHVLRNLHAQTWGLSLYGFGACSLKLIYPQIQQQIKGLSWEPSIWREEGWEGHCYMGYWIMRMGDAAVSQVLQHSG